MSESLNKKVTNATKWSAITEVAAKLVTPVISMVLARLLTPEAFGVVTTLTMIITFAEIFTDAGFQKYLVQHEFIDARDREDSTNVAFWSNFVLSMFLWGVIAVFSEPLATLVGNPGLGHVLIVACVSIPVAAFSSIQFALYKRDFDFKSLFKVRIISILIPLVVTVPLAFWLRSYWALVIGTIMQNVVNAVLLTMMSAWKPKAYFSFAKLRGMLSFTIWSMVEQVSIWLANYGDVFIVGTILSQYYLGLYKTSSTLVGQIMGLVTSITTPILFSALSRLQNDESEFQEMFYKFQKIVGILIFPIGMGIYLFSDFATSLFLGDQWMEASGFIGLWGLTSAITIVLSHYSSEVYRAKGLPKLSVLAQWLHIIVLLPVVYVASKYGFETLYIARSWIRLELVLVNLIILYSLLKISPVRMMHNMFPSLIATGCMCLAYYLLPMSDSIVWQLSAMLLLTVVYVAVICLFKEDRAIVLNLKALVRK